MQKVIEAAVVGIFVTAAATFVVELATAALPARWASPNWRWGLVGYAGPRFPLLVLGSCVLLAHLVLVDRPRAARAFSWAVTALGALLLVAAGAFFIDGLTLRAITGPDALWALDRANLLTLPSVLVGSATLLWCGRSARKATNP